MLKKVLTGTALVGAAYGVSYAPSSEPASQAQCTTDAYDVGGICLCLEGSSLQWCSSGDGQDPNCQSEGCYVC